MARVFIHTECRYDVGLSAEKKRKGPAPRQPVVHRYQDTPLFGSLAFAKDDDFRILSAEVDRARYVRVQEIVRHGQGIDFLDIPGPERLG